jgi:hypothetical protein
MSSFVSSSRSESGGRDQRVCRVVRGATALVSVHAGLVATMRGRDMRAFRRNRPPQLSSTHSPHCNFAYICSAANYALHAVCLPEINEVLSRRL